MFSRWLCGGCRKRKENTNFRTHNTLKMNLWNVKNLALPPINTYRTSNSDIDIKYLHNICQELKTFLNNKYMHAEYLLLSRIIYRMKQKFRSAKDLKALEKVNKALKIFFGVGILNDLNTFMELLPSRYNAEIYLPTKNMLDYLLVRFQGLAKLMERIVETCKISAFLLNMRIKTGHFWRVGFISLALVSRVYVLAKHVANQICQFYGKLVPFSTQLCYSGKQWLPHGYILPKDLKGWMNADWLDFDDELLTIDPPDIPDIMEFFDLVENDDDDVEFCDEYVMISDAEIVEKSKCLRKTISSFENFQGTKELRGFCIDEDVGEVIEIKNTEKESEDESNVIHLSDSSVEFFDQNEGSRSNDEGEVVLVSEDCSRVSDMLLKKQKLKTPKKKKKNKENLEDICLMNFKANKNGNPILNDTNNKNAKKTAEAINNQKTNSGNGKRKKNISSGNGKRIKLDIDTSRVKDHLRYIKKTIDIHNSYIRNSSEENRISSDQLEDNIDFSMTSEVPRLNARNKKVKKQKKKKKKLTVT